MTDFRRARRSAANIAFIGFCYVTTAIALTALALIFWTLFSKGFGGLNLDIFTKVTPAAGSVGGLSNAIVGSIVLCGLGMLIAIAVGVMAGTWLAEYGGATPYAQLVRFVNDILLSAPSVLIGLVIAGWLVAPFHGFSAFAGGVALGLIAVPIITRTTEDVLKLQPTALREAGVALGTPLWTTIRKILWKAAGSGILTGGLLAFARISGETAPLLFTSLGNTDYSLGLHKAWLGLNLPLASLPSAIFAMAETPADDLIRLAWTAALILALAVLGANVLARFITRERRPS
ncbi:phosphate ABC transporter permease PstA [Phenylobacterium montanum]|uniref:Phosphate transport system permease protein PstA n=1 Tax=Phenylobacterium montanum TaxID=2823693 RepID=A0A975G3N6_9CAUL|nr:phosphate ABC transporter permease PstA [Caulobacter sp. S6]QUD89978.1 phosphate ABC transporter permease PstA [Caulobacter sp. S6]